MSPKGRFGNSQDDVDALERKRAADREELGWKQVTRLKLGETPDTEEESATNTAGDTDPNSTNSKENISESEAA